MVTKHTKQKYSLTRTQQHAKTRVKTHRGRIFCGFEIFAYGTTIANLLKIGSYTLRVMLINLTEVIMWEIHILGVKLSPKILNIFSIRTT